MSRGLEIPSRILSGLVVPDDVELELLAFGEALHSSALDGRDMHEHIRAAVVGLDEAEALGGVEPLHGADINDDFLSIARRSSARDVEQNKS